MRLESLVAVALAASVFGPARAHAEPRRVVVEDFVGPAAGSVRASVIRAFRGVDDVALVPRDEFYETQGRLGLGLTRPGEYVVAARELDVSAFVSGTVERGRGWRVQIQVRDGSSGEIVGQTSFAARRPRSLSTTLTRAAWRRLSSPLRTTSAPRVGAAPSAMGALENEAPPPPDLSRDDVEAGRVADLDPELFPDAEERAEDSAVDEELAGLFDPRFVSRTSPLEAHVGLRAINRGFRYIDDRSGMVRPYDMPLGPSLVLGAEWYPAGHFTNDAIAHLGVTASVEQSLFLTSAGPNGASYPTSESYLALGAKLRLPLGPSRVTIDAAIARHGFTVEAEHPRDPPPDIATVGYTHGRFGLGTRIAMGALQLTFDAAYLLVLDAGEIGESHWFPNTTAHGISAAIGFIYPLGDNFQLRGWLDGRVYLLDFHTTEDDANVVAGALDRFTGATVAVAWRIPPDLTD